MIPIIPAIQGNREKAIQQVSETFGIPAGQLQVISETTANLPLLDKHLYAAKVFDEQSGHIYPVYLDASGNMVNFNNLKQLEARERSDIYGKMGTNLFSRAQSMSANDTIEVWIWLTPLNESLIPTRPITEEQRPQQLAQLRALYAEKEKPVIAWLENRGYKITYASQYAPLVFAKLTKQAMLEIQQRNDIELLDITGKITPALDTVASTIRVQPVRDKGINGSGIKVAVIEAGGVSNNTYLKTPVYYNTAVKNLADHSTAVAGVIASIHPTYQGIAFGVPSILSGNMGTITNSTVVAATEWAINQGADVINDSWGGDTHGTFDSNTMYLDHIVWAIGKTVVVSAGNINFSKPSTQIVSAPALGFNVISVGGFLQNNNGDWRDDSMWNQSAWRQNSTHNDRQLPNVVAVAGPMNDTALPPPDIKRTGNGTSLAAPQVSAEAALLMQASSSLKISPEAVRAIIMASAWHNMEGDARLSDYDGAGGIDIHRAYETVSQSHFGEEILVVSGNFPRDYYFTANAGDKVRYVIAWPSHPYPAGNQPTNDPLQSDLDLFIYDSSGYRMNQSTSYDNSYEIIQFTAPTSGIYRANVQKASSNATVEYIGYAWSLIPAKWSPKTLPSGHYINMQNISTPYSSGWSVDTDSGSDYSYDFMGWSSTNIWKVPSNGQLTVQSAFLKSDTFDSSLKVGRSYVKVYVLNTAGTSILGSAYAIDWNYNNNVWYQRKVTISGLTPGNYVSIGIGRKDEWAVNWHLYAKWADIYVEAEEAVMDFGVSASPNQGSVQQGSSIQTQVTVNAILGTQPTVSLSQSGLPSGTVWSFNPSSGTPTFQSNFTITTQSTTPTGTYPVTIQATGGGITRTTIYNLTVTSGAYRPTHWAGMTIPSGHFVNFQNITTPYGPGWHVDTIGSGDYGYDFMGYTDKNTFTVKTDGTITFTGEFLKNDDFYGSGLQNGRSFLKYYILNSTTSAIIKSDYVIDWTYSNNAWYYRNITVTGLTSGSQVRLAFGRTDSWGWDWNLKAEWTDLSVYSAGMQSQGLSGLGEPSSTSPTSSPQSTPKYSLNLTPSTATAKSGANITSTLTVTWLDKTAVPLKISINAPQGFMYVVTQVSVSNSTTTYNILLTPTDPKMPAGTYQVTVTATPDCACTSTTGKSIVLTIKVEA